MPCSYASDVSCATVCFSLLDPPRRFVGSLDATVWVTRVKVRRVTFPRECRLWSACYLADGVMRRFADIVGLSRHQRAPRGDENVDIDMGHVPLLGQPGNQDEMQASLRLLATARVCRSGLGACISTTLFTYI